jgi:hypothetical protein
MSLFVEATWAVIWPDGRVLADSTFKDEADAWKVALGWPDAAEIAHAKASGVRAVRVIVSEVPERLQERV